MTEPGNNRRHEVGQWYVSLMAKMGVWSVDLWAARIRPSILDTGCSILDAWPLAGGEGAKVMVSSSFSKASAR